MATHCSCACMRGPVTIKCGTVPPYRRSHSVTPHMHAADPPSARPATPGLAAFHRGPPAWRPPGQLPPRRLHRHRGNPEELLPRPAPATRPRTRPRTLRLHRPRHRVAAVRRRRRVGGCRRHAAVGARARPVTAHRCGRRSDRRGLGLGHCVTAAETRVPAFGALLRLPATHSDAPTGFDRTNLTAARGTHLAIPPSRVLGLLRCVRRGWHPQTAACSGHTTTIVTICQCARELADEPT